MESFTELRPAKVLAEEIEKVQELRKQESYKKIMSNVVAEINKNKLKRSVTVQSLPKEIVETLIENGYEVSFRKASMAGDVDVHTIKW